MSRNSHFNWQALGGRLGGQWERERRDSLFLLGAILCSVLLHLWHLPGWASTFFVALFAWRLRLSWTGQRSPGKWMQLLIALLCCLGVYLQYKTVLGRDAGVCLLVLFLGLKLLEVNARRDSFVVLFLCVFLLITGFFYSQSGVTVALEVLAVLALTAVMITMHYGTTEGSPTKRIRLSLILCLQALPLAAVMFVMFPRMQNPLWNMPAEKGAGKTGMSASMSPGSIGELIESNELVMRAQFQGATPPKAQLYWRGPVLNDFDGLRWSVSKVAGPSALNTIRQLSKSNSTGLSSNLFNYTITQEPQDNDWLFPLEMPVDFPTIEAGGSESPQFRLSDDAVMQLTASAGSRLRYSGRSVMNTAWGEQESRHALLRSIELPNGFNPKTIALATEWSEQASKQAAASGKLKPGMEKAALVQKILDMFSQQEFYYTLKPPVLTGHTVDDFLFGTRRGFCEHYASAFVVMARAMDIPARVVTGYQGGERNPLNGVLTIRSSDAHAWAEVWLLDQGWIKIDPTSAVAPQRVERSVREARAQRALADDSTAEGWRQQLQYRLDAWTHNWNQWVLNYDYRKQKQLLAILGLSANSWGEMIGYTVLFFVLVLGVIAAFTLRPRRPKSALERSYRLWLNRLKQIGIEPEAQDTALSLSAKAKVVLRQEPNTEGTHLERACRELDAIAASYNTLRYAVDSPSRSDIKSLNERISAWQIPRHRPSSEQTS